MHAVHNHVFAFFENRRDSYLVKEPFNFSYLPCFAFSLHYQVPDSATLEMPRVVSSQDSCAGALRGLLQCVLVLDLVLARLASMPSET